jgi:hypothetical protein
MTILCADCHQILHEAPYLSFDGRRPLCAICLLEDARLGVRPVDLPPDKQKDAEVWILERMFTKSGA